MHKVAINIDFLVFGYVGVRLLSENFSTGNTLLQNLNIYEYIFTHSFNQQILSTYSVLGNENIVNAVVVSVGPSPHRICF